MVYLYAKMKFNFVTFEPFFSQMLAKLVCCLHKPKQQTVIPPSLIQELFKTTPIQNV